MDSNIDGAKCPKCESGRYRFFGERTSYIETAIGGFFGRVPGKYSILPKVMVYECDNCGDRRKINKQ